MNYRNATIDGIYFHDKDIVYPKNDSDHYMLKEKSRDFVYDENFDYRYKKKKVAKFFFNTVMHVLVFPVGRIRYGLKTEGKENIKKYRELTGRKAIVTVSNHTIPWDIILIEATLHKTAEFPLWQEGAESSDGGLYRTAGGIPMPRTSIKGMKHAFDAMKEVVEEDKWLHIFPEASSWPWYPCLRDFQSGTFKLSVEENLPILPIAVTFREPGGLYRIFKKGANVTLRVGEPIMPDEALPAIKRKEDMKERTHQSIIRLLGLKSEETNREIREKILNHEFDK